ncbi:hypothetical protein [Enterobacter phage 03_vB_Eclo_IJM]|nr:hypothetical protein [Enterobacter phage 03_vB_Eclo_IJM]
MEKLTQAVNMMTGLQPLAQDPGHQLADPQAATPECSGYRHRWPTPDARREAATHG